MAESSGPDHRRSRIRSFVQRYLADSPAPGLSVAVIDGGEVSYAEGFGHRDLEGSLPATKDTLYGVGSLSKSVTATAVAQLVDAGTITFDDPIADHVPFDDPNPGDPVRVDDLLTHTSGIPSDDYNRVMTPTDGPESLEPPVDGIDGFWERANEAASHRVSGQQPPFLYYNTGYMMLGQLVATLRDRPYADAVRDSIFTPLGMDRSTFGRSDFEADEEAMTPYAGDGEGSFEAAPFRFDEFGAPAGGLLTSVEEFGRFLAMHMGYSPAGDDPVLDTDLVRTMHAPRATRHTTIDGDVARYGYGWMVADYLGEPLVHHGGTVDGISTAFMGFLRDTDVGVVVGCNTNPDVHPQAVGHGVLAVLRGRDPYVAVPTLALRTKLDRVSGTYESFRGIHTLTVDRDGAHLTVTRSGPRTERTFSLLPNSTQADDLTFYGVTNDGARIDIAFELGSGDRAAVNFRRWRFTRR